MKRIFNLIGLTFILFLSSCEKTDLNDETGIKLAIKKENVESPAGQGAKAYKQIFYSINKGDVEPAGGQGSN